MVWEYIRTDTIAPTCSQRSFHGSAASTKIIFCHVLQVCHVLQQIMQLILTACVAYLLPFWPIRPPALPMLLPHPVQLAS